MTSPDVSIYRYAMTFDFAAHATKLGNALKPAARAHFGNRLRAPELLPLLRAWAASSDPEVYRLAESSPLFLASDGAFECIAARLDTSSGHRRATQIGYALYASERAAALIPPTFAPCLRDLQDHVSAMQFAGLARFAPERFEVLATPLLAEMTAIAIKNRKRSGHGRTWEHGGLFAALALAPSLSAPMMKALGRLATATIVEPVALLALIRHGHPASVARAAALTAVEPLLAFDNYFEHLLAVYAALEDGPAKLRARILDRDHPLEWHSAVRAAVAMGIWDRTLLEALVDALRTKQPRAEQGIAELPALTDDELALFAPVAIRSPVKEALDRVRLPHAELVGAIKQTAAIDAATAGEHVVRHIDTARVALRAPAEMRAPLDRSTNPFTRLVLAIAKQPALYFSLGSAIDGYSWGTSVRMLEQRWSPSRVTAAPDVKRPTKRACSSAATA